LLTAITPKWLSARLRALEADAIVTRDVIGEREVRYRLTPKGQALEPVFDALLVWGMDYALGAPRHGEAIHPGRAIDAAVRYLNRRSVRAERHVVWSSTSGRIAVTPFDSMALDGRDSAERHRPTSPCRPRRRSG